MAVLILREIRNNLVSFEQLKCFQLLSGWGLHPQIPVLCNVLETLFKKSCTAPKYTTGIIYIAYTKLYTILYISCKRSRVCPQVNVMLIVM